MFPLLPMVTNPDTNLNCVPNERGVQTRFECLRLGRCGLFDKTCQFDGKLIRGLRGQTLVKYLPASSISVVEQCCVGRLFIHWTIQLFISIS